METRHGSAILACSAAVAVAFAVSACRPQGDSHMIQDGSAVKMLYTLTVEGAIVDHSGDEPLSFTKGQGEIIPGLDEQIAGMKAGDKKQVTVAPEKAYGPRNPEAIRPVPKSVFQDSGELEVGSMVGGESPAGPFRAVASEVREDEIVIDLNHPLAGKTLQFDIEIVEVTPPQS
ncbi:MAG: peptidylprolyl isomerase [Elusimicrobiota bacterium]